MSERDAVALDALRELGLERLTVWHLRCVDAYVANASRNPTSPGYAFDRLFSDVRHDLDRLHGDALREDAERVARRPLVRGAISTPRASGDWRKP